jgi:hypothetical protein
LRNRLQGLEGYTCAYVRVSTDFVGHDPLRRTPQAGEKVQIEPKACLLAGSRPLMKMPAGVDILFKTAKCRPRFPPFRRRDSSSSPIRTISAQSAKLGAEIMLLVFRMTARAKPEYEDVNMSELPAKSRGTPVRFNWS